MIALTTAFFIAALALIGKITFDIWGQFRIRRGIASGLAGEIGAYISFYDNPKPTEGFRVAANMNNEMRISILRGFGQTPSGHPVFDKVTDKLGLLPAKEVLDVSRFYNIVSGFRLMFNNLSSEMIFSSSRRLPKKHFSPYG